MSIVIDIAWDRPTVAQIQATGAVGVMRYFSTDSSKNLTAAEVAAYHAAGLGTGDVWETTTGRATQGYAAGAADARAAEAQRAADGLPADQTIYFAVDEDTSWASVQAYFDGAASILGVDSGGVPRTGCYGGYQVIEGAYGHGLRRLWQTLAWSGGQRSQHACLFQNGATALGGGADINDVLAPDWGQYPHVEADMPLSASDLTAIRGEMNAALRDPANRGVAVADNLWWWQHAVSGVAPAGASPAAVQAIAAIHAEIVKLEAEPVPVVSGGAAVAAAAESATGVALEQAGKALEASATPPAKP